MIRISKTTNDNINKANGTRCILLLLVNFNFLQAAVKYICRHAPFNRPIQNTAATMYAEAGSPESKLSIGINSKLADDKKNDTADI